MKLGYIGLGKMGLGMVRRLLEHGHELLAFDTESELVEAAVAAGARPAVSLENLTLQLPAPRLIWLMVPHAAVSDVLNELLSKLEPGDTVIDGGNSHWQETLKHAELCASHGVHFMDVGTSGGPGGARSGACLMIGGPKELFVRYEQLFADIAAPKAYKYLGKAGAGHFVKMVHNGIEYGMMQSIADGAEILKASPFDLDLIEVFDIYNNRSVIESRLVGWALEGFKKYGIELSDISSAVGHTGEGQWTVDTAASFGVPVPAITAAMEFRRQSADNPRFAGKVLSMMRNMFGGHAAQEVQK